MTQDGSSAALPGVRELAAQALDRARHQVTILPLDEDVTRAAAAHQVRTRRWAGRCSTAGALAGDGLLTARRCRLGRHHRALSPATRHETAGDHGGADDQAADAAPVEQAGVLARLLVGSLHKDVLAGGVVAA